MNTPWTPPTIEQQWNYVHRDNLIPGSLDAAREAIANEGVFLGSMVNSDKYKKDPGYVGAEDIEGVPMLVKLLPYCIELPYNHPIVIARREAQMAANIASLGSLGMPATEAVASEESAISPTTRLKMNGVTNPEMFYVKGCKGADIVTLGLCAKAVSGIMNTEIIVPTIGQKIADVWTGLATYELKERTLTTTIDTGKMSWQKKATKVRFNTYKDDERQGVQLGSDKLAEVGDSVVSREKMTLQNGNEVWLWFAAVDGKLPNRYDLVSKASELMQGFTTSVNTALQKRIIPAVDLRIETKMPEIVAANSDMLEDAGQVIKFALDHTGARASAATSMTMRGADFSKPYVFGATSPVMYWLSETAKDDDAIVPFAVTVSKPKAWLSMDQAPNFAA